MKRVHQRWCTTTFACLLGVAALAGTASAAAIPEDAAIEAASNKAAFAPSALLAVDQHRATVVERIVAEWGDKLVAANAGVNREQLREMLFAMRADQLLAASLAGSLSGLRDVLANALSGNPRQAPGLEVAGAEDLGNPNLDLVYTPVTPCRLFDTRASQGGLGTPALNVRRTYGAITPVTNQGGPGGCAAGAGAAVALIQIGTLTPSGNGLLQAGPQGAASFPNALILYQPGDQYGTAVAISLNPANGQFDLVEQFATADLYGDLLGYFRAPGATALDCATQQNAVTVNAGTFDDVSVTCAAGYTITGGGCLYFNLDSSPATQNTVVVNRSAQPRDTVSGVYLNSWACRMTNNDASIAFRIAARANCCRVPGR